MDLEGRSFVRRKGALWPADEAAGELLAKCGEGKEALVVIRRARSVKNHRHFFAILRNAVTQLREHKDDDGWPRIHDEDELLDAVKFAVGHVRLQTTLAGDLVTLPRSIDFASMGEDAFQRFKDRALYVLGQLLGCDPASLEAQQ